MRSKAIFANKSDAEAYIPEFREKCLDPSYLEAAIEEGLVIEIATLEFYD